MLSLILQIIFPPLAETLKSSDGLYNFKKYIYLIADSERKTLIFAAYFIYSHLSMEIKVFMHNSKTPVFARIIQTNDAIDLDYKCLIQALKMMFGNDILIQFNIV